MTVVSDRIAGVSNRSGATQAVEFLFLFCFKNLQIESKVNLHVTII